MSAPSPHPRRRDPRGHRHQRSDLLPVRQVLGRLPDGRRDPTCAPHDIMRLAMHDRREQPLDDDSIWLCLTCETCTARCPNGCDPARVIDALREIAQPRRAAPQPRTIRAFHEPFLEQIRTQRPPVRGRSGHAVQAAQRRPAAGRRHRARHARAAASCSLRAERIAGVDEVKRIFDAKCGGDARDARSDASARCEPPRMTRR